MQNSVISVIIPAFNEERTIGNVIAETIHVMDTLRMPYEITVVDDGSEDKTGEIATTYKVNLLSNGRNRGKGYALRKGFKHAQGDIIVTIDADGSHNPKEIPDLINPLFNEADIVAGSRFLGHEKGHTSKLHVLGNHLINATIMLLTRKLITDSQTGLRAFKKEFLQETRLESYGYEIETEMTVKSLKNGFKLKEIPICCERRRYNISKLRVPSDGFKILRTIFKSAATNNC